MKGFTLNKHKVLGVVILIIIWEISYMIIGNSVIMPSPLETLIAFKEIIRSQHFTLTILMTLSRIITSFVIGLALALVFGIFAAFNQWFDDLLSPLISLFKIVPTMALVILALIWLTNTRAPILMSVIIIFPLLYEAVIKGVWKIDQKILEMTKIYQVRTIDVIRKIYIPSILSNLGVIFSSTMGLCLKIVIGGEVLGQPSNAIGTSIQTEKMYLNTAGVLGWIMILVILSLVIDKMAKIFIYLIKSIRKGFENGNPLY